MNGAEGGFMQNILDMQDVALLAVERERNVEPSVMHPAESAVELDGRDVAAEKRTTRVLIVDDEPMIADSMAAILQREGFETLAMYGGQAALEASELFEPDVLMTDVVMPEMDGVATAMMMRRRFPKCRIVMFSGHTGATERLAHASGGKNAYLMLSKPMRPDDVITVLRSWL